MDTSSGSSDLAVLTSIRMYSSLGMEQVRMFRCELTILGSNSDIAMTTHPCADDCTLQKIMVHMNVRYVLTVSNNIKISREKRRRASTEIPRACGHLLDRSSGAPTVFADRHGRQVAIGCSGLHPLIYSLYGMTHTALGKSQSNLSIRYRSNESKMSGDPNKDQAAARAEVMECEKEIQSIKAALRRLGSAGNEDEPNSMEIVFLKVSERGTP